VACKKDEKLEHFLEVASPLAEQPFPERSVWSARLFANYLDVGISRVLHDTFRNASALLDQYDSFPGKEWISLVPFDLVHVLVSEFLHIFGVSNYPFPWITLRHSKEVWSFPCTGRDLLLLNLVSRECAGIPCSFLVSQPSLRFQASTGVSQGSREKSNLTIKFSLFHDLKFQHPPGNQQHYRGRTLFRNQVVVSLRVCIRDGGTGRLRYKPAVESGLESHGQGFEQEGGRTFVGFKPVTQRHQISIEGFAP